MAEPVPGPGHEPVRLADLTTLRLGGIAGDVHEARDERVLVQSVADADAEGISLLVVAGGSNLVVGDDRLPGRVVLVRTEGVVVEPDGRGGACVRVAAGEDWDTFVARAVASGWVGVEALSGIPGSVGATPVQNVGAYGQEVAETVVSVRAYDRVERRRRTLAAGDCGFGYRTSRFKAEPGRFLVLEVTFRLRLGEAAAPIAYAELARRLGTEPGRRPPTTEVREAVLALRAGKGMVLDPADHDTWSAGSFFTNPLLDGAAAGRLPAAAPRWPLPDGRVKTSAAWLIERAGFTPGYGNARAAISSKHTLALSNRGGARTEDLLSLAREVRAGVRTRFGIGLEVEPVLVNCSL